MSRWGTGVAVCWLALAGCSSPAPAPAPDHQRTIERWMQCQECARAELDSVRALGQAVLPQLREYLLNGPEPDRVDRVRRYLEQSHDSLVRRAPPGQPPRMDKALLVQTYLGNLDAVYRARSARALREIGGQDARAALDSARHLNLRSDVLHEVQEAFRSLPP